MVLLLLCAEGVQLGSQTLTPGLSLLSSSSEGVWGTVGLVMEQIKDCF